MFLKDLTAYVERYLIGFNYTTGKSEIARKKIIGIFENLDALLIELKIYFVVELIELIAMLFGNVDNP